jgi:malonate transporter and related proteins
MLLIVHNLVPIFVVIILGHILGKKQFVAPDFFQHVDRLVYFIFFPAMLFWKIGGGPADSFEWRLNLAVLTAFAVVFLLVLVFARLLRLPDMQVGSFAQCSFRFNTYLGLAVVLNTLGEEGVLVFGIIIALVIPFVNVLSVSTLIWFSQKDYSGRQKRHMLCKAMIANPLIIACLVGIAYNHLGWGFPGFFDNSLRLLSVAALPLALLSIGHALTFDRLKGYFRVTLVTAGLKLIALPLVGYACLILFEIRGLYFQVAMIFFALPTSTAAFILSSQLNSDPDLASAGIVLSTLLSFFSLSVVLMNI